MALLRRALLIWVGARLLLALVGGGGVASRGILPLPVVTTMLLVALVAFLGLWEARRRNEHLLLANFGVPQSALASLSAVPAAVAELAVRLISP